MVAHGAKTLQCTRFAWNIRSRQKEQHAADRIFAYAYFREVSRDKKRDYYSKTVCRQNADGYFFWIES